MTTDDIKNYMESVFDQNPNFYTQVAQAMGISRPTYPNLNRNETYHIKRIFKKKMSPKLAQSNEYGIFVDDTVKACDPVDIGLGRFVLNSRISVNDIDNIRGFNICVAGYNYAILMLEDKTGKLHFSKVIAV